MNKEKALEKLTALENEAAGLRAILDAPDPPQYPAGLTLEFSDDGDEWYLGHFGEYNFDRDRPWIDDIGNGWRYVRYPIDWSLLSEDIRLVVEFDSGAKVPSSIDNWAVGEKNLHYGTVIHVEYRPEGE